MMLDEGELERFLSDAREACRKDAQEMVGEIHADFGEAPLFVLLYADHDLRRFGRNLACRLEAHFPVELPPFTISAITLERDAERHHAFVEGPDLLAQLRDLRPFTADTAFPRGDGSVFESRLSARVAPRRSERLG